MKKMNKKAFIRTFEAIIAIIFILGFIYMITPKEMKISEEVVIANFK